MEQLQVSHLINNNHSNQIAEIQQQTTQVANFDRKSEPKNIPSLQKKILNEIDEILVSYDKDGAIRKKIYSLMKKTNSIQDVLNNISILMPNLQDISTDYGDKPIFDKMNVNCNKMKKINIKLERLFQNVCDFMRIYRNKLITFKQKIKDQENAQSNLKQFINSYCKSSIQGDFKRIEDYEQEIKKLYDQIISIQEEDEMVRISDIVKGNLSFDLLDAFIASDSDVIKKFSQEIKSLNEQQDKLDQDIFQIMENKSKNEQDLVISEENQKNLTQKIDDQKKLLQLCQDNKSQKRKDKINIDIEKMIETKREQLRLKKNEMINDIQLQIEKQKKDYLKISQDLLDKISKVSVVGKSYNIIMLLDDSRSMHVVKKKSIFCFFQKTPFDFLKEAVERFVKARKLTKNKDRISIIKFSDKAIDIHRREDISTIKLDLNKLPMKCTTNFDAAFQKAQEIFQLQSKDQSTILIFLTDGESDEKYYCEKIVQEIACKDQGFVMFTLAVGNEIDCSFLKKLTQSANKGQQILNQGQQNPIHFYQEIINENDLTKVFTDMSLGITEQMDSVQDEIRLIQSQHDMKERQNIERIGQLENQYQQECEENEVEFQQMKDVKNNQDAINYLQTQEENIEQTIAKLQEMLSQEKKNYQELKKKQNILSKKYETEQENKLEQQSKFIEYKRKWQIDIERQKEENMEFKKNKIESLSKIGSKNDAQVRIWVKTAYHFDYYIRIIVQYTLKFKLFFDRFKFISDNLMTQLDDEYDNYSSRIDEQTQIYSLSLYYDNNKKINYKNSFFEENVKENEESKENEVVQQITIEQLITQIFKDKYYLSQKENDKNDSEDLQKAKEIILKTFLNINQFLKVISFNNPIVDNNENKAKNENEEDDDDDEDEDEGQQSLKQQMKEKLKQFQDKELYEMDDKVKEAASYFLKLKVFKSKVLSKATNKKKIEKLFEKIEDFDFDDDSSEDSEEEDSSDEDTDEGSGKKSSKKKQEDSENESKSGSDSDESEKKSKKNKKKVNSKSDKKNKKSQKKSSLKSEKKSKKVKKLSESEIEELTKNLKKLLKQNMNLVSRHKNQNKVLQSAYQICDDQCGLILHQFSKKKKLFQINNLVNYIQNEMINPLDEILNFQNQRSDC